MNKEYDKALVDARRTHSLPNHEQFADVHLLACKILEMENQAPAAIVEYQLFLGIVRIVRKFQWCKRKSLS